MNHTDSIFVIFLFGFLALLAILWFLLPFAVFGTKDKLQQLIDEQIKTRQTIEKLIKSDIEI
jgi:hypothetical protein